MSKPRTNSIPVYNADLTLWDVVSEQRLARLQSEGRVARVVRHRKGHVNRAILFPRPGELAPRRVGTKYSFQERLDSGHRNWKHKKLDGKDEDGMFVSTRGAFLQVVRECLR